MNSCFTFQSVPRLIFGAGASANVAAEVAALGGRRPAIVTDTGVVEAGLVAPAHDALTAAGFDTLLLDAVTADPPEAMVLDLVEAAKAHRADCVIGLGGGSPMDTAKIVALLAMPDAQPIEQIYGVGQVSGGRLPLVLIPTTAGTGSEVTPIAIVTTGETTKKGIVAPQLYADAALLDPDLTLGLPAHVTAATGIDAMVHAIEAYTGRNAKNPMSDMLALEALRLLSANLVSACREPGNRAAREAMLRGAMLAGQAFANSPVAAVHALAYPLGGIYHVPHGLSNALVLPHVLRFNRSAAAPLYAELAEAVGAPRGEGNSVEARAADFIAFLVDLSRAAGAPQRLRDIDIPAEALDRLADDAMLQTRLLINNPREVTRDDARAIYDAAW